MTGEEDRGRKGSEREAAGAACVGNADLPRTSMLHGALGSFAPGREQSVSRMRCAGSRAGVQQRRMALAASARSPLTPEHGRVGKGGEVSCRQGVGLAGDDADMRRAHMLSAAGPPVPAVQARYCWLLLPNPPAAGRARASSPRQCVVSRRACAGGGGARSNSQLGN